MDFVSKLFIIYGWDHYAEQEHIDQYGGELCFKLGSHFGLTMSGNDALRPQPIAQFTSMKQKQVK